MHIYCNNQKIWSKKKLEKPIFIWPSITSLNVHWMVCNHINGCKNNNNENLLHYQTLECLLCILSFQTWLKGISVNLLIEMKTKMSFYLLLLFCKAEKWKQKHVPVTRSDGQWTSKHYPSEYFRCFSVFFFSSFSSFGMHVHFT